MVQKGNTRPTVTYGDLAGGFAVSAAMRQQFWGTESWCRAQTVQTIRHDISMAWMAWMVTFDHGKDGAWWGTRDANEVWLQTRGSAFGLRKSNSLSQFGAAGQSHMGDVLDASLLNFDWWIWWGFATCWIALFAQPPRSWNLFKHWWSIEIQSFPHFSTTS